MPNKNRPVPPAVENFLRKNHKAMSVPEMAKDLGSAAKTVYEYMATLKLTPKGRTIHRDHPFKVGNRKLEKTLKHFRAANGERSRGARI